MAWVELFRQSGNNTAAIGMKPALTPEDAWKGMLAIRMADADLAKYGCCNFLSITNDSAQDAEIHLGLDYQTGSGSNGAIYPLLANSTLTINAEDGFRFWALNVMNLDTGTDIAAGSVKYNLRKVVDVPIEFAMNLTNDEIIAHYRKNNKVI